MARTSCWERAALGGWKRAEGLGRFRGKQRSNTDARGKPGVEERLLPTRLSKRPLSEALPRAALNKDELNKAGGLGRGRVGQSKGGSGTLCPVTLQQMDPQTLAAGWGAATRHVCSLQPSASRDRRQQDPRLCAASPCTGATSIGSAKRCRLGERGGFTPRLHPLSYLQSILGGKLSSACRLACHGDAEWPLSSACGAPLSVLERRGAASARPAQDAPAAELGQRSLPSEGFPVSLQAAPVCSAGGRPTAWQGALEVREQTKRCWAVLSCGCPSGVGNGKASSREFMPVSSLSFPF